MQYTNIIKKATITILCMIFLIISCSPKYILDHARPTKPVDLPNDDAAHYSAQMEWWYYTGHLFTEDGCRYGFEVTFFKRITSEDRAGLIPAYWIKNVGMLGHFAITDIPRKTFSARQMHNLFRRWKADPDRFHVAINGWSSRSQDGSHQVKAYMRKYSVNLRLTPTKPAALNGPLGIVEKGGGNANYYYSYTNMSAEGTIKDHSVTKNVTGKAWMDHEYGTMRLVKTQKGWDWFSIQLDNNTELMIYLVKENNTIVSESGGTFVDRTGKTRWLKLDEISIKTLKTWTSAKTKAVYPAEWEITIKPLDLTIHVEPVLPHQELTLRPVTYWEGAVEVTGTNNKNTIQGKGYVELVGYDKKSSFNNL